MAGNAIIFYGTVWCGDCRRARAFLDRQGVPYCYVDISDDPEAAEFVMRANRGYRSVPTIVFPDGSLLVEPSNSQLADKLAGIAAGDPVFRPGACPA